MSITTIPSEVFTQILSYIPIEDASSVLRVNKEWHCEYKAVIQRNRHDIFEQLVFKNPPYNLMLEHPWYGFKYEYIADKLASFSQIYSFDPILELCIIEKRLVAEITRIKEERRDIDLLFHYYENRPDFDGWFPTELWERHKQNWGSYYEEIKHNHILDILSYLT